MPAATAVSKRRLSSTTTTRWCAPSRGAGRPSSCAIDVNRTGPRSRASVPATGTLVALAAENPSVRSVVGALRRMAGARITGKRKDAAAQQITLEYPIEPRPRWGYERPPHPELEALV